MDLSGVPLSERDLFEKNEEMIRRLLDRQLELMELKENLPKTDKTGRAKLQKEYGKINRWLGDLYQAPATYADINIEGITNKQLGERIHSHTRKVMDAWALDTRQSSKGGSSIHHGDSTMQTLGAVRTAPTGMRRDIIQAVQDQGGELATGLGGKNFFDVSEETHPLYHPGEGGKVDYKNLIAKTQELPDTATLEERLAELNRSRAISTTASEAADSSPQAVARQTDLIETIKLGGGEEVLDVYGNPFDRSIRTTEGIAALRKPLKTGLSMKAGSLTFDTAGMIGRGLTRSILPSAAVGAASLALGAGDVKAREERAEQDPSFINNLQVSLAQTERAADVAGLVPGPQTAVAEPAGLGAGLANVAIDIARDPIGTLKAVGGGIKWLVDGGAARQQSQILNPLSTRL